MLENIASVNLTELIEKKSTPAQLRIIQEVAKVINEGLTLPDALQLSRITNAIWDKWVEEIPEIQQFIHVQRLEYKRSLLRVLYKQATENSDFKIAQSLLMSAFPQEYNPAIQKENEKRKPIDPEENSILAIFQGIQQSYAGQIDPHQENSKTILDNERVAMALKDILV